MSSRKAQTEKKRRTQISTKFQKLASLVLAEGTKPQRTEVLQAAINRINYLEAVIRSQNLTIQLQDTTIQNQDQVVHRLSQSIPIISTATPQEVDIDWMQSDD